MQKQVHVGSHFPPEHTTHVISLGAGVQSTVMYLMAAMGLITPTPTAAIFADTKWEAKQVYRHLDWLQSLELSIPIIRVTAGNLFQNTWDAKRSPGAGKTPFTDIPAFVNTPDGTMSMRPRQCTQNYKIKPILKEIRQLTGRKAGTRHSKPPFVVQWMGISIDELIRCKDAQEAWLQNSYPLIEARMSRDDCTTWFRTNYPDQPLNKSSCVGCPYHSDRDWLRLYRTDPDQMTTTIELDNWLQGEERVQMEKNGLPQYLHRSGRPLSEVLPELHRTALMQPSLIDENDQFGDECHGYCNT